MRTSYVMVNAFDLVERVNNAGNVAVIVGARGSGKTGTAFGLCEEIHRRHPDRVVYAVGLPKEKAREVLPRWVILAREIDDVANGSFTIMEEAAIQFKARRAFSDPNIEMVDSIDVARHKQLSLVFISQSSALVDVNVVRLADTLIVKEPSLLQMELERRQLRRVFEKAKTELDRVPEEERKGKAFIYDGKYEGVVDTGLPSFWSDDLSRLYESYQVKANVNPKGGTVTAISYFCGGSEDFGLCPKDRGSRYVHHFQKNQPKVVMEEERVYILGKVKVEAEGIHDYPGDDNDYSQLDTPASHRTLGELVQLDVDGEPLYVRDGLLVTDGTGERLYVVDKPKTDTEGAKEV